MELIHTYQTKLKNRKCLLIRTFTVNDFFCGAGGMGLGFKQAGFSLGGAWDADKFAVESYRHNIDTKVKQVDITTMTHQDVPLADVWTFGFPCVDISVAGKGQGMIKGETRSGLFYEVMRLLSETKEHAPTQLPRIILAENVKAVRKLLPTIQQEYETLGYTLYYTLYDSQFWGVPQRRERYFMLGVRNDIERPFVFPEQPSTLTPLSSILLKDVPTQSYLTEKKSEWIVAQALSGLATSKFSHLPITEICMDDQGRINKVHKPKQVFPTLRSENHGNHPKVIEVHSNIGEPSIYKARKITPREYARLQGFPDSYEQVVSDTRFCKQMGNAVSVPVARNIALAIQAFLHQEYSDLSLQREEERCIVL